MGHPTVGGQRGGCQGEPSIEGRGCAMAQYAPTVADWRARGGSSLRQTHGADRIQGQCTERPFGRSWRVIMPSWFYPMSRRLTCDDGWLLQSETGSLMPVSQTDRCGSGAHRRQRSGSCRSTVPAPVRQQCINLLTYEVRLPNVGRGRFVAVQRADADGIHSRAIFMRRDGMAIGVMDRSGRADRWAVEG